MYPAIIAVVAAAAVTGGVALTGSHTDTESPQQFSNVACAPTGTGYPEGAASPCANAFKAYVEVERVPLRAGTSN